MKSPERLKARPRFQPIRTRLPTPDPNRLNVKENRVKHSLVVAIAAIGFSISASANLITNGSFETPTVPAGSFSNFLSGSSAITGWTVFGPAVSIVSGSFGGGGFSFPAQDGIQWLDLTGPTSGPAEGVEQTVTTTFGQTYDLSFYVGNVSGGVFGTTSTVGVLINGSLVATKKNSTPGTTLNWELFTVPFTAASASTLIGFENLDPIGDDSNGLDNISLVLAPANAVPEPDILVLIGTALAGIGWARRRRRPRQTKSVHTSLGKLV
jgi:hypothetical protein